MDPNGLPQAAARVFQIDAVRGLWRDAQGRPGRSIHQRVLDELQAGVDIAGSVDQIPASGPLVVMANHPFGILEGPVLGSILETVRKDIRFVTNSLLSELDELRPWIIAVDPFGGAAQRNASAVRQAMGHLRAGGALVVFPAGEVSSMRPPLGTVSDGPWNPMAARLAIGAKAKVLPVFFHGRNRAVFQIAGLFHPGLRTLLLPSELLARRRDRVRVAIGEAMEAGRFADAAGLTAHMRSRVYGLAPRIRYQAVAPPVTAPALESSLDGLTPILESGPYRVYLESGARIPEALREIGRLREVTFRRAGEGTGRETDLDVFDSAFDHLFLWHREHRQIAGAYRLARSPRASYLETLFHVPRSWRGVAAEGVELGRSFVAVEYQKDFLPLLLLWKGIGHFVRQHPGTRYLFGPVSVSAAYSHASRAEIMAHFSPWRKGFHPRNPMTHVFRWHPGKRRTLDELQEKIQSLEPDRAGLPVLLRQYVNLGAEILCWNLDSQFANVADGLVLLDLEKAPERLLRRYMGG